MADRKITELTNITGANLADGDEFVVVDTSADETKALTFGALKTALDSGTGFVRIIGDTMSGNLTIEKGHARIRLTGTGSNPADAASIDFQEGVEEFGNTGAYGFRFKYDGDGNIFRIYGGNQSSVVEHMNIGRDTGTVNFKDSAGNVRMIVGTSEVVVNLDGLSDYDFRVEGDANANLFKVDAGDNRVNIGTAGLTSGSTLGVLNVSTTTYPVQYNNRETSSTTGAFTALAINTSTTATPEDTLGTNMRFLVDDAFRGEISVYDSGLFSIGNSSTGTYTDRVHIKTTEALFNPTNEAYDFRVETQNESYAFFVDGDTDRVSIGHGTPLDKLHLQINEANAALLTSVGADVGAAGGIKIENTDNTAGSFAGLFFRARDADFKIVAEYQAANTTLAKFIVDDGSENQYNMLEFDAVNNEVVVNEDGQAYDFRVEGDDSTHLFYTDGANDLVQVRPDRDADITFQIYGDETGGLNQYLGFGVNDATSYITAGSASSGNNQLIFKTATNGAEADRLQINASGQVVVNPDGNNTDFQVKGGSTTHLIYAEGAEDKVGIGTSDPQDRFTVGINTNNSSSLSSGGSADDIAGGLKVINGNTTTGSFAGLFLRANDGDFKITNEYIGSSNGAKAKFWLDSAAGTMYDRLQFHNAGTVINDGGEDFDFQVKTDTHSSAFFVNGATNKVGIRTTSPLGHFHVSHSGGSGAGNLTAVFGADAAASTITNNTIKAARIAIPSYNTTHLPFLHTYADAASADNSLFIGGGTSYASHATRIYFRGSNTTGTTGNGISFLDLLGSSAGAIFNSGGEDRDFRVSTDDATHCLYVDGGDDRISMGASTPLNTSLHRLSVQSSANASDTYHATAHFEYNGDSTSAGAGPSISFTSTDGSSSRTFGKIAGTKENATSGDYGGGLDFWTRENGQALLAKMRLNSEGILTVPNQPAFSAWAADALNNVSNSDSSDVIIIGVSSVSSWSSVDTNIGSHFNSSNGRFTAPVDGAYHFTWSVSVIDGDGSEQNDNKVALYKNGSLFRGLVHDMESDANPQPFVTTISAIMDLSAGDYVQAGLHTNPTCDLGSGIFCGFLIG